MAKRAGLESTSFIKGATGGDFDNDGLVDLYVSNYGEPNFLYRNLGGLRFEEVAGQLGVDLPLMSFPTWFFDYDNDGWLDLFVASFVPSVDEVARGYLGLPGRAETMRLYRNTGGRFEDVTKAAGLLRVAPVMGANFGDLDDDGFLDLYLGTGAPSYAALVPNLLFRNRDGRSFVDVTTATGTGHLQKGHGVAFADFDADGDTDLFCNIGGFVPGDEYPKVLFANPGRGHAWVDVRLVGMKANRSAVGARLRFTVRERDGSERRIERVVTSGGSFGASPLAQRVGLGTATAVTELAITWPGSGTRQLVRDLPLRTSIDVREGTPGFSRRDVRQARAGSGLTAAREGAGTASSRTRCMSTAASSMKAPPATTAARRLLSSRCSMTQPKPSEATISGITMKKLKMPM